MFFLNPSPDVVQIFVDEVSNEEIQHILFDNYLKTLKNIRVRNPNYYEELDTKLSIRKEFKFLGRLVDSEQLKTTRMFEKAIMKENRTNLEKAYLYLDLAMSLHTINAMFNCFSLSALYFLKEAEQEENINLVYAYRIVIKRLCLNLFYFISKESPICQIKGYQLIFDIYLKISQVYLMKKPKININARPLIDKTMQEIMGRVIEKLITIRQSFPLEAYPNYKVYDQIYVQVISERLIDKYLEIKKQSVDSFCSQTEAYYLQMEGIWNNWMRKETTSFEEAQMQAMNSLLFENGWSSQDIEVVLDTPLINFDSNGFRDPSKPYLNFICQAYSSVKGLELNLSNGDSNFLLEKENQKNGMVSDEDIQLIVENNITSSIFTLDQADPDKESHPCQLMKYWPQQLEDTQYLDTLLHTDYLLKMFSTGVEISNIAPFQRRPITEGLLKVLPNDIQEFFIHYQQRKHEKGHEEAHRFWIDSEKLTYTVKYEQEKMIILFDDLKMKVKSHLLKKDHNGNLVDADIDSKDDSPEADFCRFFTKHYDTIGKKFPELLRLKELKKISAVYAQMDGIINNLINHKNSLKPQVQQVKEIMDKLRVDYMPYLKQNNETNVEKQFKETLTKNNITDVSKVLLSEVTRVKNDIRNSLNQVVENNMSQMIKNVAQIFSIQENQISNPLRQYAFHNNEQIIQIIANHLHFKEVNKFEQVIAEMQRRVAKNKITFDQLYTNEGCSWVPSVFSIPHQEIRWRVYGGVNLSLNMESRSPSISSQSTSTSSQGSPEGKNNGDDNNWKKYFKLAYDAGKNIAVKAFEFVKENSDIFIEAALLYIPGSRIAKRLESSCIKAYRCRKYFKNVSIKGNFKNFTKQNDAIKSSDFSKKVFGGKGKQKVGETYSYGKTNQDQVINIKYQENIKIPKNTEVAIQYKPARNEGYGKKIITFPKGASKDSNGNQIIGIKITQHKTKGAKDIAVVKIENGKTVEYQSNHISHKYGKKPYQEVERTEKN